MPGHVDYFASAIVYFASPGHKRRENPERLRAALQEALNKLLKDKTFTAASEHSVESVEVTKVGATLEGVARALDEGRH